MVEKLGINEAALIQRRWEEGIISEPKPIDRLNRFVEELMEVVELLDNYGEKQVEYLLDTNEAYRRALCMEIVDAFIIGLSFIDRCGYDPENLFLQKIHTNYQKYQITRINALMDQGLSREQALAQVKEEWNRLYPKDEFGNIVFDE